MPKAVIAAETAISGVIAQTSAPTAAATALNYLTTEQVKKEIKSGWIDGNMLFEEWLKYEGIFGYSEKIINIFDTCEKAGLKITNNR